MALNPVASDPLTSFDPDRQLAVLMLTWDILDASNRIGYTLFFPTFLDCFVVKKMILVMASFEDAYWKY
ncbi:hypothetical protein MUK42_16494 [Musa troglodytarum]|uniref:Uncharacterized protein n=1 Tax=Musa troglodytarum TaxID=320322 RepID=A0A9E7I3J7_9LILI|nr:hypothetical protein MUK42_16494 [Musa troglodytarum]